MCQVYYNLREDCLETNPSTCESKGCCWHPIQQLVNTNTKLNGDDIPSCYLPKDDNPPICDTCCKKDGKDCGTEQCYEAVEFFGSSRDEAHEYCKNDFGMSGLATVENNCELRQVAWLCLVKVFLKNDWCAGVTLPNFFLYKCLGHLRKA